MGLKKKAMVKVGVALLLMFFAATVEGRFNPTTLLAEALMNGETNYITKSTTTACCDKCICTRSNPPQCRCTDIGETCHSACKLCLCTRSYPPQCRCVDTNTFCYDPCSSSSATKSPN